MSSISKELGWHLTHCDVRCGPIRCAGSLLWIGWFGFNAGSALKAGTRHYLPNLSDCMVSCISRLCTLSPSMTLTLHLLFVISGTQAGMAALITHLAASSCAFTWMVIEWLHKGKPTIVGDNHRCLAFALLWLCVSLLPVSMALTASWIFVLASFSLQGSFPELSLGLSSSLLRLATSTTQVGSLWVSLAPRCATASFFSRTS